VEQLTTRTAKLIPRPRKVKKVPGFATSYHFETDKSMEEERGNLYVVIEVLTAGKQAEQVVDLVIENVGNAYFNTEVQEGQDTLSRFEGAVKSTNQALADFTNQGNGSWVGRLSAVIAVLCGEELHITQAGSAEAYLYRSSRSSHITADLQPKGIPKPANTFSNIASGTVLPGDRLVMGTPALFHQITRSELKSLLTDNTANGAITKISERVGPEDDADRIAAIVIEITTPQMLALSSLPDEPEEVHIGKPDSPLDMAKTMATPAAKTAALKGKQVSQKLLTHAKTTLVPKTREVGLAGAAWLRQRLKQQRSRQIIAAVAAIIIVVVLLNNGAAAKSKAINTGVQQYVADYQAYKNAVMLSSSDKVTARTNLENITKDLDKIAASKQRKGIEAKLAKRGHENDDPSSINGLKGLIATQIDAIDGIATITPTVLSDLSTLSSSKPTHLELVGATTVLAANDGTVYTTTEAKAPTVAANKPTGFGSLVATTASSTGDGIYLLTDEPAVWFFNLSSSVLTKQSATLDGWVKGKSISSYSGNLYVLADDSSQVWKFTKTTAGFGAKTGYFAAGTAITDATGLAVDGSVYLTTPNGIKRYTKGVQDQASTTIPDALKQPAELSVAGTTIITRDSKSNRIGVFTAPDNTIAYSKQITLRDITTLTSIRLDAKGTTIYAIADNKLVSLPVSK
jgi:hypothetical protein